jgi:NitT/TauT family transport system permease protein
MAVAEPTAELAGLDALDTSSPRSPSRASRWWSAAWPKLVAVALAIGAWQLLVWSRWRSDAVLPPPGAVLERFAVDVTTAATWQAAATTVRRALTGFAVAAAIGAAVGLAVARSRPLRAGTASLITGVQAMPSIAWFPLALVLFGPSEPAILLVVLIGAAPSVANGVVSGVDHVPPLLHRAGRALGATGWRAYRHVIGPAALPSVLAGLKQGWAFAWRSLLAGELVVSIAAAPSLGGRMQQQRETADTVGLMSVMVLVLLIGIAVDALAFTTAERALRRRRGLSS